MENGVSHLMTAGVPQGKFLVPTLWYLLDDLVPGLPKGCQTYTFADNLALLVEGPERNWLERRTRLSLDEIWVWMRKNRLDFAVQKKEVDVMKGPRNKAGFGFHFMGNRIINTITRVFGYNLDN